MSIISTVVNKDNNERYDIYDITYDKAGYPHFLIYKDGEWVRMSAKHFRPMNTEDFKALIDARRDHPIMAI